jgi:hypothetical protein
LLLVVVDDVDRFEAVVDVDPVSRPEVLLRGRHLRRRAREIANVADGGLDDVTRAEVAGDGARLGR